MTCPQCGTALEASARFCGACGHRLAVVDPAPALAADEAFDAGATTRARPGLRPPAHIVSTIPPEHDDPYVGTTLNNRFVIERKLGEGGFGAVYQGTQLGSNRRVAVKLLHPEMGSDANVVARFRREGEVLCRLRDAHSITTYDFDQTPDGTLFIAMELLEGRSLHDVFQAEAPIGWSRMLKIMSEMCSSLEEAHALGIVHRDLKPENVYLEHRPGNPEFVKVLDFGIAKVVRGDGLSNQALQLTATGQTLGTLEYMSPEQLMGRPLDGRSDVYALGVVAFELMTGRLPFPDAVGPALLIAAQLRKLPPAPSAVFPEGQIPRGVDALVARMLAKSPEQRFKDAGDLRIEVDRLLATGGLGQGAPGLPAERPAAPDAGGGARGGRQPSIPRGPTPPLHGASSIRTPVPGQLRVQAPAMHPPPAGGDGTDRRLAEPAASSTEAAIAAATGSGRWLVLVLLLVATGVVVGLTLAIR